jgi:BirA family transcriptional regulator, biotin operon repressor / biotin---[acetyl-CoA-carboxylase] ligase
VSGLGSTGGDGVDWSWSSALRDPRVRAAVADAVVVSEVVHRGTVRSTQDEVLELLRQRARSGILLVADRQLAGRGRRGRSWDDAAVAGVSLALTTVLDLPEHGSTLVPHAVGLALHDAVAATGVRGVCLKWPNDLVAVTESPSGATAVPQRRKLAGILVERERFGTDELLLVGVGVNIGGDESPTPALPDRTSLQELRTASGGGPVDRAGFLAALVAALDARVRELSEDRAALIGAYRAVCETIGRDVDLELPDATMLHGRAVDVDEDGHLVLDVEGAQHVVVAATVR